MDNAAVLNFSDSEGTKGGGDRTMIFSWIIKSYTLKAVYTLYYRNALQYVEVYVQSCNLVEQEENSLTQWTAAPIPVCIPCNDVYLMTPSLSSNEIMLPPVIGRFDHVTDVDERPRPAFLARHVK